MWNVTHIGGLLLLTIPDVTEEPMSFRFKIVFDDVGITPDLWSTSMCSFNRSYHLIKLIMNP